MRKATVSLGLGALALSALIGFGQPAHAETVSTSGTSFVTGTLTAMSGTTVPAILTVTAGATTYTVNVAADTKIVRKYNGLSDLGEFLVGDTLEVRGVLSNDIANTLAATRIKDVSIQRAGGTFKGKVVAKNCDANYFTYKPDGRSQQTVYFTTATKFTRGGEKIGCTSLVVNERAKVIGLWRKASSRIDADRVIVDMRTVSGTISAITLTEGGLPATITIDRKVKVKAAGFRMSTSESESLTTTETWTINVTSATKLFRHYLKAATIDEFLVGDKLEARGTLAGDNTLNAKWVRNSSLTIKYGDFQGTVVSVDATAKTFVFRINGKVSGKHFGDVTVNVTDATKYVDENGLRAFTDVSAGDKLKVLGTYTTNTKKLAATRIFFKEAQE
ncbi:MAG: DUF5666 domain-containing protein [Patescibacteria group bacterium]